MFSIPYIKYVGGKWVGGGLSVFVGFMKYFRHILMGHGNFSKFLKGHKIFSYFLFS